MIEYGKKLKEEVDSQKYQTDLSGDKLNKDECNPIKNLLKFLFGVIFDQGIPWKRAWKAPTGLEKRLKHLDIKRISNMETSKNIVAALVENFNRRWKQATEL